MLKQTCLSNTNKEEKTHNAETHKHKTFSRRGESLMVPRECTHRGINCSITGTGHRKVHNLYSTLLHFNKISIFILHATYLQSAMPQQPEIPLVLLMDTSTLSFPLAVPRLLSPQHNSQFLHCLHCPVNITVRFVHVLHPPIALRDLQTTPPS